jgi:predicted ATPase/DNA-binding SARP family transcriptional activator/Tfp pilus assembly protein PilF
VLVRLLGTPAIETEGRLVAIDPQRRGQLLLRLAAEPGRWVARERIAALLWPGHAIQEARRNLRKVIHLAQQLSGTQGLQANEHALCWAVPTDVAQLEAALQAGNDDRPLPPWRGTALDGADDPANPAWTEWLAEQRGHAQRCWQQLAHRRLAKCSGADGEALARALLALDPFDEPALQALLTAMLAGGRVAEARRSYRDHAIRLADELGVEPSRALAALIEPFGDGPAATPLASALAAPPAGGGFVGRRVELQELRALLVGEGCRLLTLTGPGGIGKSALARAAMGLLAGHFAAGSWWAELQSVQDGPGVIAAIADAAGVRPDDPSDPLAGLARQLPRGRCLLVLDNAEHLSALAPLVARLIAAVPELAVLVTSRAPLRVGGEALVPLAGLAVPDEDSRDAEAAASFDAVQLFAGRARAVQRKFNLQHEMPAVIAIVEALGGMPLAIELAAGWARLLPVPAIAQDLAQSLGWLERDPGSPGAAARPEHASLDQVLLCSWAQLAEPERAALAALSVFAGGFGRAAAQAVAGVKLPLLVSLADKSLLAHESDGRFGMHPVVAQFAAERLASDAARTVALALAHAHWFGEAIDRLGEIARTKPKQLADAVRVDFANLRRAWQTAVKHRRADIIERMAPAWSTFFENSGRLGEGIELLRAATAINADDAAATRRSRVKVRAALVNLLYRRGELAEARGLGEACLEEAAECGDRESIKSCLVKVGLCLWHQARFEQALAAFERMLALAEADGDRYGLAVALGSAAIAEKALGRYERALQLNQRALVLMRETGDRRGVVTRLNNIGNLHRTLRQWGAAQQHLREALALARQADLPDAVTMIAINLGLVAIETREFALARANLELALDTARRTGGVQAELAAELGLARLESADGARHGVIERLRRVVALAQAKSFEVFPIDAAAVYASWLAAAGRREAAAAVLRAVADEPALDAHTRDEARAQLERVAPGMTAARASATDRAELAAALAFLGAAPAA